MDDLAFSALREANKVRLPQFRDRQGRIAHSQPDGSDWSKAEWLQAVVGEVGELANLLKKLRRGDFAPEQMPAVEVEIRKELADVVIYLDILALQFGVDLGAAVREKFNEVSERVGADVFLTDKCGASYGAALVPPPPVAGSEPPTCEQAGGFAGCNRVAGHDGDHARSVAGSEDAAPPTPKECRVHSTVLRDVAQDSKWNLDPGVRSLIRNIADDLDRLAARSLGEQPSDPIAAAINALTEQQLERIGRAYTTGHLTEAFENMREELRAALAAPGGRAETENMHRDRTTRYWEPGFGMCCCKYCSALPFAPHATEGT